MDLEKKILSLTGKKPDTCMHSHINYWLQIYRGVTDFHKFFVYNGIQNVQCVKKTLRLAKKICEDKADLLLNEKVEINLENENMQEVLYNVLHDNNFWEKANSLVEISNALGTGAFVEMIIDNKIVIDYVSADCIYPITYRNGIITECVFAAKIADKTYSLSTHMLENGKYKITTRTVTENGADLTEPIIWNTNSEIPMFQIIKPNIVNDIDLNTPMGLSVFNGVIDMLNVVDEIYDDFYYEFKLGKKRLFIEADLLKINDVDGKQIPAFDYNDVLFYHLDNSNSETGIEEINGDIRAEKYILGIQQQLDMISEWVGFGKGYYKFDVDNVQTATAVISQNSKLYRKIKKDEIIIERALINLTIALMHLIGYKITQADVSITFDDSIIEDTDALAKRKLLEISSGVDDAIGYWVEVKGLTEEQAIKKMEEINARKPTEDIPEI